MAPQVLLDYSSAEIDYFYLLFQYFIKRTWPHLNIIAKRVLSKFVKLIVDPVNLILTSMWLRLLSMFCCTVLNVVYSFKIIPLRKRKLVTLQ